MSRRKKNPYRLYMFSLWLIGTIVVCYFAHWWEWSTSPQTEKEIFAAKDLFGNLNPEYSLVRVGIYGIFGSFIVYMIVRSLFQLIGKLTHKEPTPG